MVKPQVVKYQKSYFDLLSIYFEAQSFLNFS